MDKKVYTAAGLELKQEGDQGLVTAVFATLNVIDEDGDVTLPGAFGEQSVKLASWGHGWGELPVGRGRIFEEDEKAVFDGRFFLDTMAGQEHFTTVKNLAELQEWSYGFKILERAEGEFNGQQVRFLKRMKVWEVSPVMVGAGVDTMTIAIKNGNEGLTYLEHAEHVLASVQAFVQRSESLADYRAKEGRALSAENRDRLKELAERAASLQKELAGLLAETEPGAEKAGQLYAQYQHTLAELIRQGVPVTT